MPRIFRVSRREIRRRFRAKTVPSNPILIGDKAFLGLFGKRETVESVLEKVFANLDGVLPVDNLPIQDEIEKSRIISAADNALAHVFDLLGSGPTALGECINWRKDFKTGREWPLVHFTKIQISYGDGSDIKVVRELSRCMHFVPLGQAWRLTGNSAYADEFVSQVINWIAENPVEMGPNWECPMDVALRAVNWITAMQLFKDCGEINNRFWLEFLKSIYFHGKFILENLEYSDSARSNHYLSNIVGLAYIGAALRQSCFGKKLLDFAQKRLEEEIRHQIYPDGVNHEISVSYHRLITELFLSGAAVLKNFGWQPSQLFNERLGAMLDFVRDYTRGDGLASRVGDADDGRVHILSGWGTDPRDHRHLFYDFHLPFPDKFDAVSKSYPYGGFYFLRAQPDVWVCVRCGPNSLRGVGNHNHCEQLSFELFANKVSVITDPGTYVYTADAEARNLFRSTAYHNTVKIDDEEQNRLDLENIFRMRDDTKAKPLHWSVTEEETIFEGMHHGYERLPSPVAHKRTFRLKHREPKLILTDLLEGQGEHKIELFLHLEPEAQVEVQPEAILVKIADSIFKITNSLGANFKVAVEEGWVSRKYGERTPALILHWLGKALLPHQIETVIEWGQN